MEIQSIQLDGLFWSFQRAVVVQYTIHRYFKLDRSINDLIKSRTKIVIFCQIYFVQKQKWWMFHPDWGKPSGREWVIVQNFISSLSLRISYCCADALFSHVFAFIAVNKDETMECHAFLCRKRKIVIILPFIFEIGNLLSLGSSCFSDSRSSI